jgi:putative transposase
MALSAHLYPRHARLMPRTARIAPGDWIFHALNRANGHELLFDSPAAYREFLQIVEETAQADGMRVLAYCAMPNHWHMLLWPRRDGDLARFVHRISLRHTIRWHIRRQTTGRGHLYQARYKSFAVHSDRHLLAVCRYIERNPLRARLVTRSELWPWSSANAHISSGRPPLGTRAGSISALGDVTLTPLPVDLPTDWPKLLHEPQSHAEMEAMRDCLRRGLPYGDPAWRCLAATRLGLRLEPGRSGRPPKADRPVAGDCVEALRGKRRDGSPHS